MTIIGAVGATLLLSALNLGAIFLFVYVAAIVTALLPARRAAHVYPAEALRYE